MRPHDAQAGDVAVLDAIRRVFFHFRQDVAYDFGVFGLGFGGGRVWSDDGDEGELWPC